jgi:hypothetical protein
MFKITSVVALILLTALLGLAGQCNAVGQCSGFVFQKPKVIFKGFRHTHN